MVYFSLYMIPWIGVMQINETLVVSCCLVSYQQFFSISDCSSNLLCFSRCSLEVNKGNNFHSFGPTMCSSLCLHVWDGIEANLLQAILLLTAAHWSYHSFGLNGTDILTPFPCVMSLIMTLILNLSLIVYCVSFIYWTLSYSPCFVHFRIEDSSNACCEKYVLFQQHTWKNCCINGNWNSWIDIWQVWDREWSHWSA